MILELKDKLKLEDAFEMKLAHQQEADLIVVIHPLKESAGIYLEKWPVMKHHRACRLVNAETAAIIRVE